MEPLGIVGVIAVMAIGLGLSQLLARSMNRGIVYGKEPDPNVLRNAARELRLDCMPRDQGLQCTGVYHDAHVSVEAKWWRADSSRQRMWGRRTNYSWQVQTTFRAAFGVPMPAGMHLRKQTALASFADNIVSGGEILVHDAAFDQAYIIHGEDVAAIDKVLTEGARQLLVKLARVGDVWVDEQSIRLILPSYTSQLGDVMNALNGLTDIVREMRGTTPATDDPHRPLPVAMIPHRRGLAAELRKCHSAGGHMTQTGREALATLPGAMVAFDIDVEHIVPHHSTAGRPDGVSVSGILVGGTGRADVSVLDGLAPPIADLRPGDRLRCEGVIDNYDAYRDRTDLTADKAEIAGRGAVPFVASPVTSKVDLALVSDRIDEILPVLYTGREARERMVPALKGRVYPIKGTVKDALPTPASRAGATAYHDGLTVVLEHPSVSRPLTVRFPPDRTAWLSALEVGTAIEVDAAFMEWDELGDYAVFEERGL